MLRRELVNTARVAGIYAASVIGAGFASGQELVRFFLMHNRQGFYGIVAAGILFSVIGYAVLDRVYTCRIRTYRELIFPMTGWFMGWVTEITGALFMASVFCIMTAGSGKITSEILGSGTETGILAMAAISALVLAGNIRGVVALSSIMTPILILGIIGVSTYLIILGCVPVSAGIGLFRHMPAGWLASSILYVSYNSIVSVAVLSSLLPYLKTRRVARAGGLIGGGLLCLMALLVSLSIYLFKGSMQDADFPMLEVIRLNSGTAAALYTFILWIAMLLSGITAGLCLVRKLAAWLKLKSTIYASVIMCAAAIPVSCFGFSRLIGAVYPVFGCLGLFMVVLITADWFKSVFNRSRKIHF